MYSTFVQVVLYGARRVALDQIWQPYSRVPEFHRATAVLNLVPSRCHGQSTQYHVSV